MLVGIRGCGKRSLGFIAATALSRRFITEDHYFNEVTGLSRQEYYRTFGSQEFHARDVEVSRKMLEDNQTNCVIECGLGSLTSSVQEHLREYSKTNPVVYLVRDMTSIHDLLKLGDHSARLLESGDPTHRRCSNFEFFNLEDQSSHSQAEETAPDRWSPTYSFKLKEVKEDFTYFARFVTAANSFRSSYDSPFSLFEMPVELRLYTHAILVRSSKLLRSEVVLEDLESGGDAVELLINAWNPQLAKDISKQVASIRRKIGVPIVFSVDLENSSEQDPVSIRELSLTILDHGFRLGVEFVSIDLDFDDESIKRVVGSKGPTRVIGHYFEQAPDAKSWDDDSWVTRYDRAEKLGCDVVRLLQVGTCREENESVRRFTEKIRRQGDNHPPLIAYNTGQLGRTSQVFNTILTSVTHSSIRRDIVDNGPQITSKDAVQALFHSFVLDPLKYYVFGTSVSFSLSPAMHNAAYRICGMDHEYKAMDITSFSQIETLANDPHFGGASIALPYKVSIMNQLASKSRHAEAIGAVNTLLPIRAAQRHDATTFGLHRQANQRNRAGKVVAWYGDNTDWIGIMICLNRNLSPRNVIKPLNSTGLVIGAGGMARAAIYAMLRLGCRKIFIFNRNAENAEKVARHFNSWASPSTTNATTTTTTDSSSSDPVITVLPSSSSPWPSTSPPPTMLVSCVPAQATGTRPAANFTMPLQWLSSPSGGVVIDLAYKPLNTPLLKQIRRVRAETGIPWVTVDGLETLPEQGIAQFELMTGRKAPRGAMRMEVLRRYQGEGEEGGLDEGGILERLVSIH